MPIAPRSLLAILLCLTGAGMAPAQKTNAMQATQLEGLNSDEAARLIAAVKEAQAQLRGGGKLYFILLSGAPASYEMAAVAPRDAFLRTAFDRPFRIARPRTDNSLWRPHRITLLPDGPGQLMWDVEVVLGHADRIEQIQMIYRPPPPF